MGCRSTTDGITKQQSRPAHRDRRAITPRQHCSISTAIASTRTTRSRETARETHAQTHDRPRTQSYTATINANQSTSNSAANNRIAGTASAKRRHTRGRRPRPRHQSKSKHKAATSSASTRSDFAPAKTLGRYAPPAYFAGSKSPLNTRARTNTPTWSNDQVGGTPHRGGRGGGAPGR